MGTLLLVALCVLAAVAATGVAGPPTAEEIRDWIENMPDEDADMIWVWALRRCGGVEAEAEDLQQETLLALFTGRFKWKVGVPRRAQAYWVMRRLRSKQSRKASVKWLVSLAQAENIEEEYADATDPEKALALKGADSVYERVRAKLPEGRTRDLWEIMYVDGVDDIAEQAKILGETDPDPIYTARKLIKRVCREVFEAAGYVFRTLRKTKEK